MEATPNLENSNNGGFLWPPIADALDTYLRRRFKGADSFERIWRIIHLWEAIEITLALASISSVRADGQSEEIARRQREFFYGKSWDPLTDSFKELQGAADGAIDQWINILDEVAKAEDPHGRFLMSLKAFLCSSAIDVAPIVTAWAKACDVPLEFQASGTVDVRVAMRYVNSFRNRLAHVPFPHDSLAEVSAALENATEQLFSVAPLSKAHEKEGRSSPLTGALRIGSCFLHGGHLEVLPSGGDLANLEFVFPCQKKNQPETWSAGVLVHIDPMVRPHVLTRAKGHDVCEYTRFRAEANAVLVVPEAGIAKYLPEPEKREYVPLGLPPVEEQQEVRGEMSQAMALEAIRDGDFDAGIAFFAELVKKRPDYHVGWLRLGHATREKAVRIAEEDQTEALRLLKESLASLKTAASHIDPNYKALAHYERSKTYARLARLIQSDQESRLRAVEEATEACKLSSERKYLTWLEYLQAYGPALEQSA